MDYSDYTAFEIKAQRAFKSGRIRGYLEAAAAFAVIIVFVALIV